MPHDAIREQVAEIIRTEGVRAACEATDLPREQVLRLAAGAGVRRGTLVIAEQALERRRQVGGGHHAP